MDHMVAAEAPALTDYRLLATELYDERVRLGDAIAVRAHRLERG